MINRETIKREKSHSCVSGNLFALQCIQCVDLQNTVKRFNNTDQPTDKIVIKEYWTPCRQENLVVPTSETFTQELAIQNDIS